MAYKAPIWEDGKSPAISAENLNNLSKAAEGAQVLYGNSAPTSSTEGAVGQFYLVVVADSDGNYPLYQCVAIANGSYTWVNIMGIPADFAASIGLSSPATIHDALSALVFASAYPKFKRIVFKASQNWTSPASLIGNEVFVLSVGGGGGGGATGSGTYGGYGGGGGSGYLNTGRVAVQPGETYPIVVGAGGKANGGRGGSTSFNSQIVAEGGYGGSAGLDGSTSDAGTGGNGGDGLAGGGGGGSKYGATSGIGGKGGNGTLGGGGGGGGAGATMYNYGYNGVGGNGGNGGTYGGGGGGGASGNGGDSDTDRPVGGIGGIGGTYGGNGGQGWGGGSTSPSLAEAGKTNIFDVLRAFGVNIAQGTAGTAGKNAKQVDSNNVGGAGGGGGVSGAGGDGGWSASQRGGGAGGGGGGIATSGSNPGTGAGGDGGNSTETSNRHGSGGGGGGGGIGCPGNGGGGGSIGGGGGGGGGVRLSDLADNFGQGGNYATAGKAGVCVICYFAEDEL